MDEEVIYGIAFLNQLLHLRRSRLLSGTIRLVLTLCLVATTHLQRHDGSIDWWACALTCCCLILTLALYLQIRRSLGLLCLRLLVYLLLSG